MNGNPKSSQHSLLTKLCYPAVLLMLAMSISTRVVGASSAKFHTASCNDCDSACDAALIPNIRLTKRDESVGLKILDVINESTFETIKKGVAGSSTFPIEGIPVSASMTWSEFQQKRHDFMQSHNYIENTVRSFTDFSSEIPKEAYDAWLNCISIRNHFGWSIWPSAASDDSVVINIRWIDFPEQSRPGAEATIAMLGNEASSGSPQNIRFSASETKSFIVKRSHIMDLLVNVNGGDSTASYKLLKPIEPPKMSIRFDPAHPVVGDRLGLFVYFVCEHGDLEGATVTVSTFDQNGPVIDSEKRSTRSYVISDDNNWNDFSATKAGDGFQYHCLAESFGGDEIPAWTDKAGQLGLLGALNSMYGRGQRRFDVLIKKDDKEMFHKSYTIE